jgi:hypothetical protein
MGLHSAYKISLKVSIFSSVRVEIKIINVDRRIINKNTREPNPIYIDKSNGFTIWSFNQFLFNEKELRLPSIEYLNHENKYTHVFKSEMDMYSTLKRMYYALSNWASDPHMFPNDFSRKSIKPNRENIDLTDIYWLIK